MVRRRAAFLITLAADYCATCSDAEFCALVEHELYHVGHVRDPFGAPAFDKEGRPRLRIVGLDVEEFAGVVARYGPTAEVRRLASAASAAPGVHRRDIARACGVLPEGGMTMGLFQAVDSFRYETNAAHATSMNFASP